MAGTGPDGVVPHPNQWTPELTCAGDSNPRTVRSEGRQTLETCTVRSRIWCWWSEAVRIFLVCVGVLKKFPQSCSGVFDIHERANGLACACLSERVRVCKFASVRSCAPRCSCIPDGFNFVSTDRRSCVPACVGACVCACVNRRRRIPQQHRPVSSRWSRVHSTAIRVSNQRGARNQRAMTTCRNTCKQLRVPFPWIHHCTKL